MRVISIEDGMSDLLNPECLRRDNVNSGRCEIATVNTSAGSVRGLPWRSPPCPYASRMNHDCGESWAYPSAKTMPGSGPAGSFALRMSVRQPADHSAASVRPHPIFPPGSLLLVIPDLTIPRGTRKRADFPAEVIEPGAVSRDHEVPGLDPVGLRDGAVQLARDDIDALVDAGGSAPEFLR